ncbi:MAG: nitroreductase family protein [Pseudomonadota bacterium]
MPFFNLIRSRRSVRAFTPTPVEREKVDLLVEAALRAPSSRNTCPWEFIVVDDAATIAGLACAKPHGAGFLAGAPLAVVVTADPKRCDVWIEDAAIATTFIHLAAHSLGLGSCWIQLRNRQHTAEVSSEAYVRDLLGIPDDRRVLSMVAVGYPERRPEGHAVASLPSGKVFQNRYGTPR